MLSSMAAGSALPSSASRHRERHQIRFALDCEFLENRQLLSIGQGDLGAESAATAMSAPQQSLPPATAALATSSETSVAAENATPGGTSTSQVGYLLNELSPTSVLAPFQAAGVSIPQTLGGSSNTLTDLSVTVLNPDMTSSTAAIVDTQVDSDAYLIPSSPDLLRDHLGQSTLPLATHLNTAATVTSQPTVPRSPVASSTTPAVMFGGSSLSANVEVNPASSETLNFVEPSQAQPGSGSAQTPSTPVAPQSAPQPEQASPAATGPQSPAAGTATPPAASPTQSAAPSGESQSPPQGAGAESSDGFARRFQAEPMNEAAVDAALELTDLGTPIRVHDGDALSARNDDSHTDPAASFSAVMGAAALATAGYNLVIGRSSVSRARVALRWSGAERPGDRKTG